MANDTYTIPVGTDLLAGWPAPAAGSIPAAGQSMSIAGYNWVQAVRPPAWAADSSFRRSVFNSYGSGVFVPHYSEIGAFAIAGSGGHGHPPLVGGVGFDFSTRAPFYVQGEVADGRQPDWTLAQSTNDEWMEVAEYSPLTIPAPAHIYRHLSVLSPENGGGPLGSLVHVTRAAILKEAKNSNSVHSFDLYTGKWSRRNIDRPTNSAYYNSTNGMTVYDKTRNVYFCMPQRITGRARLLYWSPVTGAFGYHGTFPTPPNLTGASPIAELVLGQSWIHEGGGKRCMMYSKNKGLQGIDLDNPNAWVTVAMTGPNIPDVNANSWVYHPLHDAYYMRYPNDAGQTLWRMRPSENPLQGPWYCDIVALGGDVIPEYHAPNVDNHSYASLFYIPALQVLGWVSPNGVSLINPEHP